MMTLAVVLLSLVLLGALTHFVPALRSGRTGYPSNQSVGSVRVRRGAQAQVSRLSPHAVRRATQAPQRASA